MNSVVTSGIFALTSLTSTSMLSFSSVLVFLLSLWQRMPPAAMIRERLGEELPVTPEKQRFLDWYSPQKETPEDEPGGE